MNWGGKFAERENRNADARPSRFRSPSANKAAPNSTSSSLSAPRSTRSLVATPRLSWVTDLTFAVSRPPLPGTPMTRPSPSTLPHSLPPSGGLALSVALPTTLWLWLSSLSVERTTVLTHSWCRFATWRPTSLWRTYMLVTLVPSSVTSE